MIDACVKSGNMKLAFELFEEMQLKNELKPDVFTYSSLIKGIKSPENIGNNNNLKFSCFSFRHSIVLNYIYKYL